MLNPFVNLFNHLRFKVKFGLLALVFFVPLTVSFGWIVLQQLAKAQQNEQELIGHELSQAVVELERMNYRPDTSQAQSLLANLSNQSMSMLPDADFMALLDQLTNTWQQHQINTGDTELSNHQTMYQLTLSLREQLGAYTGLSRQAEADRFYLSAMNSQWLPELNEYVSRIGFLNKQIISNEGFDAQSYTLIVALNNRIDDIQLQLEKALLQYKKVAQNSDVSNDIESLLANVDDYQQALNNNVIEPDNIQWSSATAKQQNANVVENIYAVWQQSSLLLTSLLQDQKQQNLNYLYLLSAVLVVSIVLIVLSLIAIYYSIKANVVVMQQASSRMGEGDFSQAIQVKGRDEFSDIAVSFNTMHGKIASLLRLLDEDVVTLNQDTNSINALSEHMEQQLSQAQQNTSSVVSSIGELSQSVGLINDNIDSARTLTNQANSHVIEGEGVISDTADVIEGIATEVNNSAQVINTLAKNSDEIAQFLKVIREIAEQTNLLALNAAIEAARAGEYGRGFAVVAGEVGTLAGRTQEATAEIQRIIGDLQSGAEQAVKAMEQGVEKANHGVTQTQLVASAFGQITADVTNIVQSTDEITTAVHHQRQMIENIEINTQDIDEGSSSLLVSAKETASAVSNVATLTEDLARQLSQFKLNN